MSAETTNTFITAQGRTVIDGVEQPTPLELVVELRRTLGMFDGAMDKTPKAAWEEALSEVRKLVARDD